MATYEPAKRATAYRIFIHLQSANDPVSFQVNPTLASGDAKVSKDGGAFANLTTLPVVTPAGGRAVQVDLSGTEMTADLVVIEFVDQTSPKEWADFSITIPTAARQFDDLAYPATSGRSMIVDAAGVVDANVTKIGATGAGDSTAAANLSKSAGSIGRGTVTTGASTTSVPTSAFSPTGAVANQFKDRAMVFDRDTTTTTLRGVAVAITASTNAANPTFTVGTLPATPASGDTFSVV